MGKNLYASNGWLALLFQGSTLANIADNAAGSPLTSLWCSLHTADPGAGGAQNTSEVGYTSYARVPVVRTSSGWTVPSGGVVSPVAAINFPLGTGGGGTAAFLGIGTDSTGAGHLLYSGPITPNIVCGLGVQPQITTASTVTED